MLKKEADLKIDFNDPTEFSQLWDDMTQKLRNGREAYECPSVCYILRDEKYDKCFVYTVVSRFLDKKAPPVCHIIDNRKISLKAVRYKATTYHNQEGINVNPSYYWDTNKAKILEQVVRESGFSLVDQWLDNWKQRKNNFEFDKEYEIWLIKVLYPHTQFGIRITNNANEPIP